MKNYHVLLIFFAALIVYVIYMHFSKKNGPSSFSKGDQVSAFGNVGTVKSISSNGMFVEVVFSEASNTVLFTIDGKVHSWNKKPSLRKL